MVRRDDDGYLVGTADENPESRRDDLAGESPASGSTRAPSSAKEEIPTVEAGYHKRASQRELISEERVREPQHQVKPASKEKQSEGRASHVMGKATSTPGVLEHGVDFGGVEGAARVQRSSGNTRDPSAPPSSRLGGANRPSAKGTIAQRKSDGVIVPTKVATKNAIGGKGHERGQVGNEGKRLSGKIWEHEQKRVYFLHRQPSRRAMKGIRQRVRNMTPPGRCHDDLHNVIADLNPVLRGWGAYFKTGNAARCFNQIDTYVFERLQKLHVKRAGRNLAPARVEHWSREYFERHGLHRLRGTVEYPEATQYRSPESPPASRVREIRKHGFYGGRMETRATREGK